MHQTGCAPLPRAAAVAKAGGRQTRYAVPRFIADVYLCRLPHLSEMQTVSFVLSLISALGKYDDGVAMSHARGWPLQHIWILCTALLLSDSFNTATRDALNRATSELLGLSQFGCLPSFPEPPLFCRFTINLSLRRRPTRAQQSLRPFDSRPMGLGGAPARARAEAWSGLCTEPSLR